MSDTRNRILPPVFRTGIPLVDRNLDIIHATFRRLSDAIGVFESDTHYDITFSIPVFLGNGLIPRVMMVRSLAFPVNLVGSEARIFTAPTSNGTVNIGKNGTTVATAALTAGSNAVTLAAESRITVDAGDWISIEPPTTDATAADFSITLKGERL